MKREQRSPRKVATARRKARRAVQPAGHPKAPSRPRPAKIPAILLEGDASPAPAASGPGQRYALGPAAPPKLVGEHEESGELPEAYGTKRLSLTVRDPHWVCAHWDLTREQLRGFNAASVDGHLVVRLYGESMADQPCAVAPVHPESLHWFIPVPRGGEEYAADRQQGGPDAIDAGPVTGARVVCCGSEPAYFVAGCRSIFTVLMPPVNGNGDS